MSSTNEKFRINPRGERMRSLRLRHVTNELDQAFYELVDHESGDPIDGIQVLDVHSGVGDAVTVNVRAIVVDRSGNPYMGNDPHHSGYRTFVDVTTRQEAMNDPAAETAV